MHNNVLTRRSTDAVFKRIGFAIQKGLAAQLVARLPSTTIKNQEKYERDVDSDYWIELADQVVNSEANRPQAKFSTMTKRFGTVFDDPMTELKNVKYDNSSKEYHDKFDYLLSREFVDADDSLEDMKTHGVQLQISLNALSRMSSFQTLRVVRLFDNKHELHILVNSGSTLNFLDINMAKRLGYRIKTKCPLSVIVDGDRPLVSEKWRGYLLDRHFIIKTYHYSIKYLLDQRITTPTQMKWFPKLMGFDYEVKYKKWVEIAVANALPRRYKPDLAAYLGLLQPLNIPDRIWESIFMDFIEGQNVIFVVVDRLTKYADFMSLVYPFSTAQVAQLFLDTVYKLHGLPTTIVSNMDKVFLSSFRKELFQLLQVKLLMSTTYYLQTNGQIEVVNRCLKCYLRCMTRERPKDWTKWLPLAKLKVDIVDRTLEAREQAIQMLKFHLERSQNRMKQQADKKRSDRVLKVGDWAFLKLQPHRQVFIRQGKQDKFSPKSIGPIQVTKRIDQVAYTLELPTHAQNHDVFHVDIVDRTLEAREQAIQMLKFHLERSQNKMKQQADKKRSDRVLKVGDWAFLKLQPHRHVFIRQGKQDKFSPKSIGPIQVTKRIDQVSYTLELPTHAQNHDVFHVS
nr:hypothetical protein [Tanacetum cinerariifolium]